MLLTCAKGVLFVKFVSVHIRSVVILHLMNVCCTEICFCFTFLYESNELNVVQYHLPSECRTKGE